MEGNMQEYLTEKKQWETAGSLHRKDPGNSTKQISRDNPLVGRRKT